MMPQARSRFVRNAAVTVMGSGLLACLAACSDSGGSGSEGGAGKADAGNPSAPLGGGAGSGGSHAGGAGPNTHSGGSGLVNQGGAGCEIESASIEGCVGTAYEPETIPLDIYIMFDQSGSMLSCTDPDTDATPCADPEGPTRLDGIRSATELFLRDPASVGIRVGIGYFGYQMTNTSCDPAQYSEAAVGIDMLPAHADAIMESLNAIEPVGETPTGAAIRGACDYAQSHKKANPGHKVVILLVTDGEPKTPRTCPGGSSDDPNVCCPTLDDAVEAATECSTGTPAIQTYVLGVGPFLGNLRDIAAAGGTDHAYLVEGGDVSGKVLEALNSIRGAATIPCEMQLPDPPAGQVLNKDEVNMVFANAACDAKVYARVEDVSGCTTDGGWYYDDPTAPQKIELCPTSCDEVSIPGGQMIFSVGCRTVEIVR